MMLHQALHLCEELVRLARVKPRQYGEALQRAEEIRLRFLEDPGIDPELSAAVTQCIECLRDWLALPAATGRSSAALLRALRQLRWAVEYSYDGFPLAEPLRSPLAGAARAGAP